MWESRRDFQRVWEGWEAGFLAFHAFLTLSFPWPAFRRGDAGFTATATSAMGRARKKVFVAIVVDECFGDLAEFEATNISAVSRFLDSRLASKAAPNCARQPNQSLATWIDRNAQRNSSGATGVG